MQTELTEPASPRLICEDCAGAPKPEHHYGALPLEHRDSAARGRQIRVVAYVSAEQFDWLNAQAEKRGGSRMRNSVIGDAIDLMIGSTGSR